MVPTVANSDSDEGSSQQHVTVERDGPVGIVTFDRPPVNATTREVRQQLCAAFRDVGVDRQTRVVLFRTGGDRTFIGGADLRAIDAPDGDIPASEVLDRGHPTRDLLAAIRACPVPVIAVVQGPALGAGLAYASACDLIVASERATFGAPEINVGLLGASSHLMRMVGFYKARELYMTGDTISAGELAQLGVIARVVPHDQLFQQAHAFATRLAEKSPIAMRLAKQAMNRIEYLPVDEAYRVEQDYTARLLGFDDAQEGRRAFLEKRAPEWKWR
jgi:enoyl-CoA hydratase